MKNKAIKTKLLTVLLALCMVLSLVPMTAFAATVKLPAGVRVFVVKPDLPFT